MENNINLEYESPDVWFSVTLLAVFAGLFVIAILRNKSKKIKSNNINGEYYD